MMPNREELEKIINSLDSRNRELQLRVNWLENLVDVMNDYISDNNLKHYRFYTENGNGDIEYIDFDEYKDLQVIVIPETRYIVSTKKGEDK